MSTGPTDPDHPGTAPTTTAPTTTQSADEKARTVRRAIGASAMGNMTEWFDYGVYA